MKLLKTVIFIMTLAVLSSCFGDKKSIIGADLGNTSFVNKNFQGNTVEFNAVTDVCSLINKEKLASLYNVSADAIVTVGQGKFVQNGNTKTCMVRVKLGGSDWNFLTGMISLYKEVSSSQDVGGISEAIGQGENWEEAWSLKKSMSKSAKWIPKVGKAALYTDSKRKLEVKLEGYTLEIVAPGAPFNKEEQAKNRDFEKISLQMVKDLGFIK
ncbi:hypothetical protein [uncultured Tenacibaculum sp.]|uniref:hypothetical protein n=1 Tax=uncultured Tenacibaculum sp. TaxID=174713 RepID=UPI00261CE543|nr:hypothetical protein [uncultured Tenacibaculum sp.]